MQARSACSDVLGDGAHQIPPREILLHLPHGDWSRVFSQEIKRAGDQEVFGCRLGALAQTFWATRRIRFLRGSFLLHLPSVIGRVSSRRSSGEQETRRYAGYSISCSDAGCRMCNQAETHRLKHGQS
jgi:hypothetical protein